MTIAAMIAARVATAPAPSVAVVVDGRSAVAAADVVPVVRAVDPAADREVPAASAALAPELPVPGLRPVQPRAVVVLA
jgi:hypothetical protein